MSKIVFKNIKKIINYLPINDEKLDSPITYEEMKISIKSLKNNKAPGSDFITNEDFKKWLTSDDPEILGNEAILKSIFKVICTFWDKENIPPKLKQVILRPFIKDTNEDEHDPSNYRTISLLNTVLKIYEGIIHKRLTHFLEGKQWFSSFQEAYRNS